jgi:hypothetical protein
VRVELLLGQLFEPDGCGVENRLGLQGRNEFLAEAVQDGAKRSAHGEGIHPANHFDKLASVRVTSRWMAVAWARHQARPLRANWAHREPVGRISCRV